MRLLAELFFTALAIVIQLGVPVVVIFIAAFMAERANRRRLDPRIAESHQGNAMVRFLAWLTAEEPQDADQVRASLCPSCGESEQPLPTGHGEACWQAMKTDSGRLRSECVGCQSFLSSTTAG